MENQSYKKVLQKYISNPGIYKYNNNIHNNNIHNNQKKSDSIKGKVLYYDENYVLIHDLFPKANVHLLLIPRDLKKSKMHPLNVFFNDNNFWNNTQSAVEKSLKIAIPLLQEKINKQSNNSLCNNNIQEKKKITEVLPDRVNSTHFKIGFHSNPSLSNLHLHIISIDMTSQHVKNANHYVSFNSDFFIPFDQIQKLSIPLIPSDDFIKEKSLLVKNGSLICWRCGKNFGRKFKSFKQHLDSEYSSWISQFSNN